MNRSTLRHVNEKFLGDVELKIQLIELNERKMENIALSDSNDDLTHRPPPLTTHDEQQHVTSELHDAANTDVTKGKLKRYVELKDK